MSELASTLYTNSMGSSAKDRRAAAMRLDGVAQLRVCLIRSSVIIGLPTTATGDDHVERLSGEVRVREAVCRIWVGGIVTVIIMWRGGYCEGGAVPGGRDSRSGHEAKEMALWFCYG